METHARFFSVLMLAFITGTCLSMTGYAVSAIYTTTTNTKTTTAKVKDSSHHHKRAAARFAPTIPATGTGVFIYDPRQLQWAAYNAEGNLIRTGAGSGGANYCRDLHGRCHTPVGTFTVYRVGGAACKSKKFPLGKGGAPMPHCAYFHGGYAVHGSYEVRPYNASHGCIRVYPKDAAWLNANILRPGGTVIVKPY